MECKKEQVNADTQQLSKYMFEDHWNKREMHLHFFYMLVYPQTKRFICIMLSFYYYYQNPSILVKIKAFVMYK